MATATARLLACRFELDLSGYPPADASWNRGCCANVLPLMDRDYRLTCAMNCRALVAHERVSANSRQASRESASAPGRRRAILIERADGAAADDIARPHEPG